MYKRGLSEVVSTMILVVLVVGAVGIVGSIVNNLVKDRIEVSNSCFNVADDLKINKEFTCIDGKQLNISLIIGDIVLDKILISVSDEEDNQKTFEISDNPSVEIFSSNGNLAIPPKNSGRSYSISLGDFKAVQVKVVPVVNGNVCEITDSINQLEICGFYN